MWPFNRKPKPSVYYIDVHIIFNDNTRYNWRRKLPYASAYFDIRTKLIDAFRCRKMCLVDSLTEGEDAISVLMQDVKMLTVSRQEYKY